MVDFKKVREDSQEVEYPFGFPTMHRRLVIQKDSQQGRPADGRDDLLYRKAVTKIVLTHRDKREWPDLGGYAA